MKLNNLVFLISFLLIVLSCKRSKVNCNEDRVLINTRIDTCRKSMLSNESIKLCREIETYNDSVKGVGNTLNGLKDSVWIYTLDSEVVKIENWFKGKKFGGQYLISKSCKSFKFFNIDSENVFSYDISNGKVIDLYGCPIYIIENNSIIDSTSSYINLCYLPKDTFGLKFNLTSTLIRPNNSEAIIFDSKKDNFTVNKDKYKKMNIELSNLANGDYTIVHLYEILNNDNDLVLIDRLTMNFKVK